MSGRTPVLLYLHGLGGDHSSPFTYMGLQGKLDSWISRGGTPFAIATVDGLDSWWRPQPHGIDGSRMLIEEFLPLLARRGFDIDTLSLAGASMGGYGALRLASSSHLEPRSVSVFAPAIGSSDGAGSTDVSRHPDKLRGIPVQLFVGRDDELRDDDFAYARRLRRAGVDVQAKLIPGGHDPVEMSVAVPRLIKFTGEHLR
jgi:predicted esterase